MYFETKTKDLGIIKPNSNHVIEFKANHDIPDIQNLHASCGCSQPSFDRTNLIISVTFKAGPIPKHLKGGQQSFKKTITVTYENNKKDILSFTGIKK